MQFIIGYNESIRFIQSLFSMEYHEAQAVVSGNGQPEGVLFKDGSIDVAFLLQEHLQSDSLAVGRLIHEPLELIAPADHVLAGQPSVRPADLDGETILLTENGCGYRHLFEQELSRAGVYSVVKLEFSSVEAIKQCVIAGLELIPKNSHFMR